jgi:hypothetical protein
MQLCIYSNKLIFYYDYVIIVACKSLFQFVNNLIILTVDKHSAIAVTH